MLELLEHEPRHDQRAVDEPGLDDLGDPAVDEHAGVDDDPRLALGLLVASRRGRRIRPAPSAAAIRSNRFATVRPIIPRPRNSEIPSGSQVPSGPSIWASGRPEQQAQQEADEQAEDRGHELGGRQLLDAA